MSCKSSLCDGLRSHWIQDCIESPQWCAAWKLPINTLGPTVWHQVERPERPGCHSMTCIAVAKNIEVISTLSPQKSAFFGRWLWRLQGPSWWETLHFSQTGRFSVNAPLAMTNAKWLSLLQLRLIVFLRELRTCLVCCGLFYSNTRQRVWETSGTPKLV